MLFSSLDSLDGRGYNPAVRPVSAGPGGCAISDIKNRGGAPDDRVAAAYETKRVVFRYRGVDLTLALSHGLFSSSDVDAGTRLLLKVLSKDLDARAQAGKSLPRRVLDGGCGVGVVGLAAASALRGLGVEAELRAQDRDELARAFSAANAAANGFAVDARAEPLLADPPPADGEGGPGWDLILSNLPAKAGEAVLADFFSRAARLLRPQGWASVVIVLPLADAARAWLEASGAPWRADEATRDHAVFTFGAVPRRGAVPNGGAGDGAPSVAAVPEDPAYGRGEGRFEWEDVPFRIRSVHGVEDFDTPGRGQVLAAKLLAKLAPRWAPFAEACASRSLLVHEPGQGHFAAFLAAQARRSPRPPERIAFCGRNVLALGAAAFNAAAAASTPSLEAGEGRPCADLGFAAEDPALAAGGPYGLLASFPELVPRTDRIGAVWAGAAALCAEGGLFMVALESAEAGRLDKMKPPAFSRAGDLKRDGWRAMAYQRVSKA